MVRKVWMAVLMLMAFACSAVAEELAVQLVVRPAVEPFPGLTWKSDFEDAVAACRGNDITMYHDDESGVTALMVPNVPVSGCTASFAGLILNDDRLGAVYYEIDHVGKYTFDALKACYATLYGEQYDGGELFEPSGRLFFNVNGVEKLEELEVSEDAAWWEKTLDTAVWFFKGEITEVCTWVIDNSTLLTLQHYVPNSFMGSEKILINYTAL